MTESGEELAAKARARGSARGAARGWAESSATPGRVRGSTRPPRSARGRAPRARSEGAHRAAAARGAALAGEALPVAAQAALSGSCERRGRRGAVSRGRRAGPGWVVRARRGEGRGGGARSRGGGAETPPGRDVRSPRALPGIPGPGWGERSAHLGDPYPPAAWQLPRLQQPDLPLRSP